MATNAKKAKAEPKHHHEKEDFMYFRVDTPLELRKEILKSAIDTTQILRRYESYKGLSHLKSEVYQDFNRVYKDIDDLSRKLRTKDLPVIEKVREDVKKARLSEQKSVVVHQQDFREQINSQMPKQQEAIIEKHALTDQEKLDDELRDIQSRLRKLGS